MRPSLTKHLIRRSVRVSVISAAVVVSLAASLGCNQDNAPSTPAAPQRQPRVYVVLGAGGISLTPGQSASVPFTVERDTYTGTMGLVVSGLPPGVTAAFDPPSLPQNATAGTLQLSVATTAGLGSFTLQVDVVAADVGRWWTWLGLMIADRPSLTLRGPGLDDDAYVVQGNTDQWVCTIDIIRGGGFTGAVQLTVEGLPAGVTAAFDPVPLAATIEMWTSTRMKLSAAANVPVGSTNVTIHARGEGVPDATTTMRIWVFPRG
ncbi:MAG TPA: hypothetical protein VLN49_08295 [Gemmatimonadaceae bacterium]|nr:hypothetical protein [Gemmatimonadaceae bacterium]